MRIVVFSDIHGNAPALRAAVAQFKDLAPDRHVFLGDLGGYYPDVGEVFDELQSLPGLVAIRGNHDEMFLEMFRAGAGEVAAQYVTRYGGYSPAFLDSAKAREIAGWLHGLEGSRREIADGVVAVHGSLTDPVNGRMYAAADCERELGKVPGNCRQVLFGHTHYPLQHTVGGITFINPGSIGQPRHGGAPSFYVFDTGEESSGRHVQFEYDRSGLAARLEADSQVTRYSREVLWRY